MASFEVGLPNIGVLPEVPKPSVPVGTRNAPTPPFRAPNVSGSVTANTTARSAAPPLLIHCLAPASDQPPSTRRARVRSIHVSLPASGSDRAKHIDLRPATRSGRYAS